MTRANKGDKYIPCNLHQSIPGAHRVRITPTQHQLIPRRSQDRTTPRARINVVQNRKSHVKKLQNNRGIRLGQNCQPETADSRGYALVHGAANKQMPLVVKVIPSKIIESMQVEQFGPYTRGTSVVLR